MTALTPTPPPTAGELIKQLNLVRHPEGGWFCESYRSDESVSGDALPERFGGRRAFSTAIYFLLESGDISVMHRLKSDEIWHYYAGSSLSIHVILPDGSYQLYCLGGDLGSGDQYQVVVRSGCWFGAEPAGGEFSLAGCTVSPGFDFADFEMADRRELSARYPEHIDLIVRMTKEHL